MCGEKVRGRVEDRVAEEAQDGGVEGEGFGCGGEVVRVGYGGGGGRAIEGGEAGEEGGGGHGSVAGGEGEGLGGVSVD